MTLQVRYRAMRSILLVAAVCLYACGGGGGGGNGGDDDDQPIPDGPVGPQPDGPTNMGTSALGTTCTPDANNPQGDCPAGFECLNLQGATNPWCSKTCTTGAGDTCATDYSGSGKAACILTVSEEGGANPRPFCAVICEDLTSMPANQICPAGQCDGTCPGALMCTTPLRETMDGPVIGNACQ